MLVVTVLGVCSFPEGLEMALMVMILENLQTPIWGSHHYSVKYYRQRNEKLN